MASIKLPPCPPQLKSLQHYLKLASDYENRQPVITYWARLYSLQSALKIDRKSPEAKALLTSLMDWLETFKKLNTENEAITSDVAGQALVENEGHKLFTFADREDRAEQYNKNVVKSFYTAGILFDVCEVFGELTEEIASQRKYAKWKATYIHNCLKKGEIPIPGPIGGDDEEGGLNPLGWNQPQPTNTAQANEGEDGFSLPPVPGALPHTQVPPSVPQHTPQYNNQINTPPAQPAYQPPPISEPASGVTLVQEDYTKAQKYCKWAISALDYEDKNTALQNLHKAMNLLMTGKDES